MKLTKELLREMIKEEISNSNVLNEKIGFFSKLGSAVGLGSVAKSRGMKAAYDQLKGFSDMDVYGDKFTSESHNIIATLRKALKGKVEKSDQWEAGPLEKALPKIENQAKFADEYNTGADKAGDPDSLDVVTGALVILVKGMVDRPKGAASNLRRINSVIEDTIGHERGHARDSKTKQQADEQIRGLA